MLEFLLETLFLLTSGGERRLNRNYLSREGCYLCFELGIFCKVLGELGLVLVYTCLIVGFEVLNLCIVVLDLGLDVILKVGLDEGFNLL